MTQAEFEYVSDDSTVPNRKMTKGAKKKAPSEKVMRNRALYGLAMFFAQQYVAVTGYDYPAKDLKPIMKALHSLPESYTIADITASIVSFFDTTTSWYARQDPPLLEAHFWQKNISRYLPSKKKVGPVGTTPGNELPEAQRVEEEERWDELSRARRTHIELERGKRGT